MQKVFLVFSIILSSFLLNAQQLKPGFDKAEYKELMLANTRTTALPDYYKNFPAPETFKMVYQSAPIGLDNLWDLWVNDKSVAAISIRGTTKKEVSWLANFYCAMVPAKGELRISDNEVFKYQLASNPKAAVHVGWLISVAFLSKDILPKIDSCYKAGIKDIFITGHSQGGGISYLLTAYLYHLQQQNLLPADIRFKTYCSAAPKPGNLYFAYDYEALTQAGWAYNVVNSADWVPESPFSIQTVNDFNTTNPFVNAKQFIKKQPFPKNIALKYVYNKLDRPVKKAQRRFEKYLGKTLSKSVQKNIQGFAAPQYYHSSNYVRTGNTIVLAADSAYYRLNPDNPANVFTHHLHKQYLYLLSKLK
jgi:Lipase (class 3)